MKSKNVKKVFELFATKVVETARGILNAKGKNASGELSSSLGYRLNVDVGTLELRFLGAPYASIVDEGVRGVKSSAKAPKSPFKYTKPVANIGAIDKWVVRKGIRAARDSKGRFVSRKSLVYLMSRKIALFGIEPTNFFTDAINQGMRGLPNKFARAYVKDAQAFIQTVTKEM